MRWLRRGPARRGPAGYTDSYSIMSMGSDEKEMCEDLVMAAAGAATTRRNATPVTTECNGAALAPSVGLSPPTRNLSSGPVCSGWSAAATGPGPPRSPLPDPHCWAAAAAPAVGGGGPFGGTLGLPRSATSLWKSFVFCMTLEGVVVCLPYLQGSPLRWNEQHD